LEKLKFLLQLAKRDFLEKYTGSVLGVFWAFILPAVNIAIYTVIFSQLMAVKLPSVASMYSYGLYLAAGLLPWTTFSNTVIRVSSVFLEKKHIITKLPINLLYFPLSVVISETVSFFISMAIYIPVIVFLGIPLDTNIFWFFPALMFQQIFALSLGLVLATLNVFIRDIKEIVNIVMQLWFWLTPIVYTINILPDSIKKFIIYNPSYAFIHVYQNIFVLKEPINLKLFFIYSFVSVVMLFLSYLFFKKLEKDIRDFL